MLIEIDEYGFVMPEDIAASWVTDDNTLIVVLKHNNEFIRRESKSRNESIRIYLNIKKALKDIVYAS